MSSNLDFENLFQQALDHRAQHDCSAPPYEEYQKLSEIILIFRPKTILEIGTGIGFTATVMALTKQDVEVETIEKDVEHIRAAREFFEANKVNQQIKILTGVAEEILPSIEKQYDLIFFDGFQIHYEFLPQYQRLIKPGGILVLGNNQLTSRTSDKFFEELNNQAVWRILERFADTTVILKK